MRSTLVRISLLVGAMSDKSAIEWTDATWNPVTGCTKISPGCAYCYAESITLRFKRGGPFLPGKTTINLHHDRLDAPGKWRSPRRVFVNSMSDLFHEEVPFDFVREVFLRMAEYDQHIYQVLTKRPERMLDYVDWGNGPDWPDHVWAGVSVENQYWADRRIPLLADTPARVRFLSVEPLLKAVDLRSHLADIQWVIVGGESGSQGETHGRRVGNPRARRLSGRRRAILLQAVGWTYEQVQRQDSRRTHVGPNAGRQSSARSRTRLAFDGSRHDTGKRRTAGDIPGPVESGQAPLRLPLRRDVQHGHEKSLAYTGLCRPVRRARSVPGQDDWRRVPRLTNVGA